MSGAEREKARLRLFEYVKERKFPDDETGDSKNDKDRHFEYEFPVQGWLPMDLSPAFDPDTIDPLPLPDRVFSLAEKTMVLSAIHDAYLPMQQQINPYAAIGPTTDPMTCQERWWYDDQVQQAFKIDSEHLEDVKLWLAEVAADLKRRLPGVPGSRTDDPPWYHESNEQPLPQFTNDKSLTGTKKDLGICLGGKGGRNERTLENKAKAGSVWVRRHHRQKFEVFFRTQHAYATANAKMLGLQGK